MIIFGNLFGTSSEKSSNTKESSTEVQKNADSEEGQVSEAAERQAASDGRANKTDMPIAKPTSEPNPDTGRSNPSECGTYLIKKPKAID